MSFREKRLIGGWLSQRAQTLVVYLLGYGAKRAQSPNPPHCPFCHTVAVATASRTDLDSTTYNEQPPSYIHYSIEWKVTLNNRVVAKDTEQDLVSAPSSYWQQFLKEKPDNVLRRTISHDRRVTLDDTTILVSSSSFSSGAYHLTLEESHTRKADKRGVSSVTQRMLAERETQIDTEHASGQPAAWREVYRMMRCPGPPCHQGAQYCWQDPVGKKHHRLRTHHLRSLVRYVEQGGVLETHDDVPDTIREQLYAEEQQSLERQQKAKQPVMGSTYPPININVRSAQSPQSSMLAASTKAPARFPPSGAADTHPIKIPGLVNVAVEEYSNWHKPRVSSEMLKDDIKKACDVVLANGLDLKQIYQDRDPDFFVKNGVKLGVARRSVSDISEWVKQYEWN
ncbi:hypothetical protein ACJ73_03267 [Blastomyces percursus]|uniref:Uncharacterized protein n=1 Tax=Blastomyces percursus TaxID=1658174 RepID=A0A1J9RCI1_9EURO|nr:hypothetical protein ACJ73_03267 [Blastomyces percursus]